MSKIKVETKSAPDALGPYSQAIIHQGIVYCSGQIAIDPNKNTIVEGGITEQADQVMKNLKSVLMAANSDMEKILKCTIYLNDMSDFAALNEVYSTYFKSDPPARETVAVKGLPKDVKVEISCIAYQ
tara:strand:- start:36945 stop:37325 length:381 start_codon:yes stop_codon:yes gene_type:complete